MALPKPSNEGRFLDLFSTDSDDEIPSGWEERVSDDGNVFYANHNDQATQWHHPITGLRKQVVAELPYGWVRHEDEDKSIYFEDTVNKRTSTVDPRLAFKELRYEDRKNSKSSFREWHQVFDGSSTAEQVLQGKDLTGSYVIVTGGNSGIGLETAKSLAFHGAHVCIASRDVPKSRGVIDKIKENRPEAILIAAHLDLSTCSGVKDFVDFYLAQNWPLNILILNAAVYCPPFSQSSKDSQPIETTMRTNHFGHFHLVYLLQDLLVTSQPSRVITVSSESHRFANLTMADLSLDSKTFNPDTSNRYRSGVMTYNNSKLCNLLLSLQLHLRLGPRGVTCITLHPGNMIYTSLSRYWWVWKFLFFAVRPFTKSLQQGAATTIYCATSKDVEGLGGTYFNNCWLCETSSVGQDIALSRKLWEISKNFILSQI